ncbi:kinesin-like protein Klp8 [Podila clonocystis]|nr:kinesin-like protein Klp8 [Podila clonocystis]
MLKIIPGQKVDYPTDGTSVLVVQASWDSTLHESLFLNRVTASNARILLTLSWSVEAERCEEPVRFKMDIAAQIQDRKSKAISSSYRLTSFLTTAPKIMSKVSGLFLLTLRPIVAKKASELWRMNTASKYVRGEEYLAGWKPRGVSLLQGFKSRTELIRKREAVERTRQCQDPPSLDTEDPEVIKQPRPSPRLQSEVKLVTKSDNISKKGYLYYPEARDEIWVKRWFVIRRPYMYIYSNNSETDDLGVINLTHVRVDYKRDLEEMLNFVGMS